MTSNEANKWLYSIPSGIIRSFLLVAELKIVLMENRHLSSTSIFSDGIPVSMELDRSREGTVSYFC